MSTHDEVLDAIDQTLSDYEVSGDAMRWTGESDPREAENQRRERMWATYGQPRTVDAQHALWTLGLLRQIHKSDVVACLYSSDEAADAYEAANLEYYGHPTIGRFSDRRGVIGVLDLRPCIKEMGRLAHLPLPPHQHWSEYHRRQKRRNR